MFDTSLNEKNLAHQVELVLDHVRIVLGAQIFVEILFKGSTLGPVRAMYDIETFTEWLLLWHTIHYYPLLFVNYKMMFINSIIIQRNIPVFMLRVIICFHRTCAFARLLTKSIFIVGYHFSTHL